MAQYSLDSIDNYLDDFDSNASDIFAKYLSSTAEFVGQSLEAITIANIQHYKYVIIKGIETITHVFRFLILYTRNLEVTYYNCKKALYYYIEFIGQIGEDSNDYLSLTSNDAALFVYKKTIFTVINSYKKDFLEKEKERIFIDNIFSLTELFQIAFKTSITRKVMEKNSDLLETFNGIKNYGVLLMTLILRRSDVESNKKLKCMLMFSDKVFALAPDTEVKVFETMCKKLDKININNDFINETIEKTIDKCNELTPRRYINLVISEIAKLQ